MSGRRRILANIP